MPDIPKGEFTRDIAKNISLYKTGSGQFLYVARSMDCPLSKIGFLFRNKRQISMAFHPHHMWEMGAWVKNVTTSREEAERVWRGKFTEEFTISIYHWNRFLLVAKGGDEAYYFNDFIHTDDMLKLADWMMEPLMNEVASTSG